MILQFFLGAGKFSSVPATLVSSITTSVALFSLSPSRLLPYRAITLGSDVESFSLLQLASHSAIRYVGGRGTVVANRRDTVSILFFLRYTSPLQVCSFLNRPNSRKE